MFPRFLGSGAAPESYLQSDASSTDARVLETAAVISGTLTGSTIPATAVTMAFKPLAGPLGLNLVFRSKALPPLADSGCLYSRLRGYIKTAQVEKHCVRRTSLLRPVAARRQLCVAPSRTSMLTRLSSTSMRRRTCPLVVQHA